MANAQFNFPQTGAHNAFGLQEYGSKMFPYSISTIKNFLFVILLIKLGFILIFGIQIVNLT